MTQPITSTAMPEPEKQSIAGLIRAYGKRLFGFVRSRVDSPEDTEDILQEVWYQLSKLANIDDLDNAGAWLFRVARNKVTDRYRKKQPEALEDFLYADADGDLHMAQSLLAESADNPETAFFQEYFWEEFLEALDELPEKQREVFVLHELEDLTLQEIADQSGEPLKTIISRKGYAVKRLRERLAHLYQALND
jgi:RNA polymerase sigma factor (sigma-70 family)